MNMTVEMWSLDKITPYARNARQIPPEAVDKVAGSIREFSFRQAIVVDSQGVIICGHTRLLAARKLGMREVPVHVADSLTPAQVRAYRLLDNRSHEETTWDSDLLAFELIELKDLGLDLDLTGFNSDEIDELLNAGNSGLTDEDAVPDVPEAAVSQPGDVWLLGNHRLLCGDATDARSLDVLMAGELADMVFTDPPYNVDYTQTKRDRAGKRQIANDNLGLAFGEFLRQACQNVLAVTKGAIYICMSSSEIDTLKRAFAEAGGHWSTFVIWAKNAFTLGRSDYQRQYEPILYGWPQGADHYWCGARDQGDVWFVNKPVSNDLHPTMKPVELIERAIRNSSKSRDTVLDVFGGSGSTIVACEKTGRQGRVIEIDPRYVDTTVLRSQQYSGQQAVLHGDGRSFAEVSAYRQSAKT
jgi:DNA modification methylase